MLEETNWPVCAAVASSFTDVAVGRGRETGDAEVVADGCWLEEARKELEEERGEGRGCGGAAAPADEASPEKPSEKNKKLFVACLNHFDFDEPFNQYLASPVGSQCVWLSEC